MEGSSLIQQLSQILEEISNVYLEVKNYGEDSQAQMQDLAYKLQLVLEWCESVVVTLKIMPPLLLNDFHSDIPILVPNGPNVMVEEAPLATEKVDVKEEPWNLQPIHTK